MLIHNADITGSLTINGIPFNSGSFSGSFRGDGSQLTGITGATTASYVEYSNVGNKPALVSGSEQISFNGIVDKPTLVSGSAQITYSGLSNIPVGIVSGSTQISFNGITDKPALVSGSSQITYSGLSGIPSGIVSGSSQVSFNGITDKPTLVSGSAQISYPDLSNIPNGIVSSSTQITGYNIFATTGSNTFNGAQTITGSIFGTGSLTIDGCITATGQIVAQTINVQQVTSSIVYSCGSNIFGTSLANTQQFTGSLQVTGSNHYLLGNVGINSTNLDPNAILTIAPSGFGVTGSSDTFIHLAGDTSSKRRFLMDSTSPSGPVILGRQANGTQASLTATAADNTLLFIDAAGHNGTIGYNTFSVAMQFRAAENYTTSSAGSYITFSTTPTGSIAIAEAMRISPNGNIGIGTASPNNLLQVGGTTNGIIRIDGAGDNIDFGIKWASSNASIYSNTGNAYLTFATNDSERLRITSGGNVGIGTTSPVSKLNVSGDNITVSAGYGIAWSGDQTRIMTPEDNVAGALIRYGSGAAMRFVNGSTEHMRINGNGNVGIGTCNPVVLTQLEGNNANAEVQLRLVNNNLTNGNKYLALIVGGTCSFGISGWANSGILESAAGTNSNLVIGNYEDGPIIFQTNNRNEKVRITGGGFLGIGTTSPCYKLDVRNASGVGAQTIVSVVNRTNDSNTGAFIGFGDAYTDTVSPYLFAARVGGTREGSGDGGFMSFYTRPTSGFEYERMRITAGGIACFACQVCAPNIILNSINSITSTAGSNIINSIYAGTDGNWLTIQNAGGILYTGLENSTSTTFGATPYSAVFYHTGARNMEFFTASQRRLTISSTGIACFACQVCAPAAIFSGCVGIGTTSLSTEANLFLGAQGVAEGGQLVLQKATNCNCATHLDNFNDSFRILSGTDTGSTAVHMTINHTDKSVQIFGPLAFNTGGKIIDSYFAGGGVGGNNALMTFYTVPSNAKAVLVIVQGNFRAGVANNHNGYNQALFVMSGCRIHNQFVVPDTSQGQQSFCISYSGGNINVCNNTSMANTQSGDSYFIAFG
jgi:hypothetical protein